MRVLMNVWEWPPHHSGGLGVAAASLAWAAAQSGLEVLAHAHHGPASRRLDFPGGGCLDLRVDAPGQRVAQSSYELGASAYDAAADEPRVRAYAHSSRRLARAERFDLIHGHDWLSFPASLEARAISGRPFVAHVHSLEIDRAGGDSERVRAEVQRIEGAGLAVADRVVAVSRASARELAQLHPLGPRLRVIPNGVHAELEEDAHGEMREPQPRVLFAGRLTHQKGPDRFVEAALRLAPRHRKHTFTLVGEGDLQGALARRIWASGQAARVQLCGARPRARLLRLMAESELLVLPSRREPYGLVALEAALRGVPVVLDRGCGALESLPSAPAVDCADPAALAGAIEDLMRDSTARRELGQRLRAEARRATWQRSAELLIDVYRELMP